MGSIKVGFGRVVKDMFSAFGLCRGAVYISVGVVAYLLASHFDFVIETNNIDRYIQYLGAAVGLSFAAYSIIVSLGSTLNKFAKNANDGKSPLENLFAVFTCSICFLLLTFAVMFIYDGTGNITYCYIVVGLLFVSIISLCDVGLIIFTLHKLF